MWRIVICACLFLIVVVGMAFKYERDNPCLEYGPERLLYMQQVGTALVPVYGQDCLRRGNP